MTDSANGINYVPGMYAGRAKKRVSTAELAGKCIRQWEEKQQAALKEKKAAEKINYCISFSRKIGVGALEIADLVADKTGFRVVDREILEYIANNADLNKDTVDFFDERHPGAMNNFGAMLFGGEIIHHGRLYAAIVCSGLFPCGGQSHHFCGSGRSSHGAAGQGSGGPVDQFKRKPGQTGGRNTGHQYGCGAEETG